MSTVHNFTVKNRFELQSRTLASDSVFNENLVGRMAKDEIYIKLKKQRRLRNLVVNFFGIGLVVTGFALPVVLAVIGFTSWLPVMTISMVICLLVLIYLVPSGGVSLPLQELSLIKRELFKAFFEDVVKEIHGKSGVTRKVIMHTKDASNVVGGDELLLVGSYIINGRLMRLEVNLVFDYGFSVLSVQRYSYVEDLSYQHIGSSYRSSDQPIISI